MSIVPSVSPWYDPSSARTRTCGSASSDVFASPPARTKPRRTYQARIAIFTATSIAVEPLSLKNTLFAQPFPAPSSSPRDASSAASCAFSGNMTCPHRPAAAAAARCSRRADSFDTPCVHQLAEASNLRCTAPGLDASASGTYTPKSSPERLSMTVTSPTRSCCVNGHQRSRFARAGAERSEETRKAWDFIMCASAASKTLLPSSSHSKISEPS
mmetsp:Transcript_3185/g.12798  ORF Transcript_3185/g.12798 Transcript_3185/m.12798 type:complete len:214 (+) Transcript_3185:1284-1925(+)